LVGIVLISNGAVQAEEPMTVDYTKQVYLF